MYRNINDPIGGLFSKKAYKHALSMVESSGGVALDNENSSAAGNYHFLYNLIQHDPDLEGISKREFINRPELHEKIMDKALAGNLTGYEAYGEKYANKLIDEFGSNKNTNEIAALVHFLGPGNTRNYLRDPENFNVPGKTNATVDQYLKRFNSSYDDYVLKNPEPIQMGKAISPSYTYSSPKQSNEDKLLQPIDNTAYSKRDLANMVGSNQNNSSEYGGDPEMLFKEKYNTPLTKKEEYNSWVNSESKRQGRDITMDLGAYDIQGFWKSGDHMRMDEDNHGSDRWKKPNHPTFSKQSNYHNVDGYSGGTWSNDGGYTPSEFTNSLYDKPYYERMFGREPHRPEYLKTKKQSNSFKKGGQIDPTDPPTKKDKQDVLDYISNMNRDSDMQAARDRANSQSIRPSDPKQSFGSKALEVALNPMTAAGYAARGKELPDNFSRGPRNPLDYAVDVANPFQYVNDAKNLVQGVSTLDGAQALEGAVGVLPIPLLGSAVKKGSKKLLKNTHKINPFAESLNNPNSSYRVAGFDAAEDFKKTGELVSKNRNITNMKPGASLLERVQGRSTAFPSFQKGYADLNYLPDDGGVIFKTDLPTFKRGDINPVTGKRIGGRHYAHRVIGPDGNVKRSIPASDVKMYDSEPHWLMGHRQLSQPGDIAQDSKKLFSPRQKSEIDWGKWNKEIPENKALMKEYDAIEQQAKADGTWMKNSDGSEFKGTPEQFVQQNSKNFKKAFGKSKVLDKKGNPQIVKHTTDEKNIEEFDMSKFGQTDGGFYGKGIYSHPQTNDKFRNFFEYGDQKYQLYKNIENPIPNNLNAYYGREGQGMVNNKRVNLEDYWKGKHDGVITDHKLKDGSPFAEYVTQPENIKSATGNNGMFDMTNPNIYKALVPAAGVGAAMSSQENEFKQGGLMQTSQGDASNMLTLFENGGSHEENSLGGIPQGIGPNGKPNLVEQGETKWQDYIFSNAFDMDGNYTGEEGKKVNVFKKGGMLKRADGSYSKRGLWDNIRANRGSGKKPTAAMLKQERKINKKYDGGDLNDPTDPPVTDPIDTAWGVINDNQKNYIKGLPEYNEKSLKNPSYTRDNYVNDFSNNSTNLYNYSTPSKDYRGAVTVGNKNCINGVTCGLRDNTGLFQDKTYQGNLTFDDDLLENGFITLNKGDYNKEGKFDLKKGDLIRFQMTPQMYRSTHENAPTKSAPGQTYTSHTAMYGGIETKEGENKGKHIYINNEGKRNFSKSYLTNSELTAKLGPTWKYTDAKISRYNPSNASLKIDKKNKENKILSGYNKYASQYNDNNPLDIVIKDRLSMSFNNLENYNSADDNVSINQIEKISNIFSNNYNILGKSSNLPPNVLEKMIHSQIGIAGQESEYGNSTKFYGKSLVPDSVTNSLKTTGRNLGNNWDTLVGNRKKSWTDDMWKDPVVKKRFNNSKASFLKATKSAQKAGKTTSNQVSKGIFQQKELSKRGRALGLNLNKSTHGPLASVALQIDNYHKLKKVYPDLNENQLIDLSILAHNQPSKAFNKMFVDYYLSKNKIDYVNKVKAFRNRFIEGYKDNETSLSRNMRSESEALFKRRIGEMPDLSKLKLIEKNTKTNKFKKGGDLGCSSCNSKESFLDSIFKL